MKQILKIAALVSLIALSVFISCKKELSCESCRTVNQPPVANAIDGSTSSDPDGSIISYKWAKIAGTVSSKIVKPESTKTVVKTLVTGVYQF